MKQTTTDAPEQASPLHPRAAAVTVNDLMRSPLRTAGRYDHAAAAAYLMKHAGTTALMVTDAQTGQPARHHHPGGHHPRHRGGQRP